MAKEFEVISIWFGRFPSEERLKRYMEETYDDGNAPISEFATDQEELFYDHDFVEFSFRTPSQNAAELLADHSFSSSYIPKAIEVFHKRQLGQMNSVILVWGVEIDKPVSKSGYDYELHYLGTFSCISETY